MKILGLSITREKAAVAPTDLTPTYGAWTPLLHESFAGAWQRGVKVDKATTLTFHSLFACVTLIASDIAKLGLKLCERDANGILQEVDNPAFSPVLRRPNRFQNRIEFIESWMLSKLIYGNAYILKVRDNRGVVVAMYVLNPARVTPLVAPGAAVYYRLQAEELSTLEEAVTVPASEIIHDRMNPIYHPLVGVSPISACGLAAQTGIEIQRTSSKFFENGARPGGVLTAPGKISQDTADRLKAQWDNNYGGENVGKVAVLTEGLEFKHMSVNPVDAQLIEQLKYSAEMVCTAFHVPPYKVGVGQMPTYQNAQILNQIYYTDCLQRHIEGIEAALDQGLKLPGSLQTQFNLDDLLRMDAQTQMGVLKEGTGAKIMTPNEARKKLNLPPQEGGDELWGQQQDHSLGALSRRDEMTMPDGSLIPELEPIDVEPEAEPDVERMVHLLTKELA